MDLLYSSPLALTFEYLNRWFYEETSLRDLFKEFFEADRRNAGVGCDEENKYEEYDFIVGNIFLLNFFRNNFLALLIR